MADAYRLKLRKFVGLTAVCFIFVESNSATVYPAYQIWYFINNLLVSALVSCFTHGIQKTSCPGKPVGHGAEDAGLDALASFWIRESRFLPLEASDAPGNIPGPTMRKDTKKGLLTIFNTGTLLEVTTAATHSLTSKLAITFGIPKADIEANPSLAWRSSK